MKILIVHNNYSITPEGGEANVVKTEIEMLKKHGHDVLLYERTNSEIEKKSLLGKLLSFITIPWSPKSAKDITKVINDFKPEVMHVHNYKFVLTPSIFKAAKKFGVRVVHTLHNYRLLCPAGLFLCHGEICEDCYTKGNPFRVLKRRCLDKTSFLKNILGLYLYLGNHWNKLFVKWVDAYIVLSEFAKKKYVKAGIPDSRLFYKPNFMDVSLDTDNRPEESPYAVVIGRISKEKGVLPLIKAWNRSDIELKIIGNGPLKKDAEKLADKKNITFLGHKDHNEAMQLLKGSMVFIFPSACYEGFPLSLLEAMAYKKPIIATDLGARNEIIEHGITGFLFNPQKYDVFNQLLDKIISDKSLRYRLGEKANEKFILEYSEQVNYNILMNIYGVAESN